MRPKVLLPAEKTWPENHLFSFSIMPPRSLTREEKQETIGEASGPYIGTTTLSNRSLCRHVPLITAAKNHLSKTLPCRRRETEEQQTMMLHRSYLSSGTKLSRISWKEGKSFLTSQCKLWERWSERREGCEGLCMPNSHQLSHIMAPGERDFVLLNAGIPLVREDHVTGELWTIIGRSVFT